MQSVPDSIRDFFQTHGRLFKFGRGDLVLHAHTKPSNIYLITEGIVKAYSVDKTGGVHLHTMFGPGKCLPLMRVVNDTTNHVICEAQTDVTTLRVSKQAFMQEIDNNPQFAKDLLKQALVQFSHYTDRIENLEYSSARERLLYRFLSLAGSLGEAEGDMVTIKAQLSHEDLAQSIQVSREVVSRLMGALKKQAIIDYQRGEIRFQPQRVLDELRDLNLQLDYFNL